MYAVMLLILGPLTPAGLHSAGNACLVEIGAVRGVQRAEDGVLRVVIAAAGEIDAAHVRCHAAGLVLLLAGRVQNDCLLVVCVVCAAAGTKVADLKIARCIKISVILTPRKLSAHS